MDASRPVVWGVQLLSRQYGRMPVPSALPTATAAHCLTALPTSLLSCRALPPRQLADERADRVGGLHRHLGVVIGFGATVQTGYGGKGCWTRTSLRGDDRFVKLRSRARTEWEGGRVRER